MPSGRIKIGTGYSGLIGYHHTTSLRLLATTLLSIDYHGKYTQQRRRRLGNAERGRRSDLSRKQTIFVS